MWRRAVAAGAGDGRRRCGARTRGGGACRSAPVRGRRRCRMHGGAKGTGAPRGNRNALRHGLYTRAAVTERRRLRTLIGEAEELLDAL